MRLGKDNLRRLAAQGVRHYVLVTNVGSTANPETGTFDQMDKKLEAYAKDFGYEQMTCIWRETLNPWVDNAPTETKWAYAEMLAGWDVVRYLVAEHVGAAKDKGLRDLIGKVAAAQWEDDKRVKFSQSDVDREAMRVNLGPLRCIRMAPTSRSRTLICWLSADCAMHRLAAARVKFCSSASVTR